MCTEPATQYIISLRAFNNHGKGQVIYDLIYTRETTGIVQLYCMLLMDILLFLRWLKLTQIIFG